jgi:hypothetical protein
MIEICEELENTARKLINENGLQAGLVITVVNIFTALGRHFIIKYPLSLMTAV